MWKTGDRVVYSNQGVCDVMGIEQMTQSGKTRDYLLLVPVNQPKNRLYIPMHNEAALAKIIPLLTRRELEVLLASPAIRQEQWEPVETKRKQLYHELLARGSREALLTTIYTLYAVQDRQRALGRRLHICDENFLRDAEHSLAEEISFVLELSQDQAKAYLERTLRE